MTPDELMNRYLLARIISWRHELELLDAEVVAALLKVLKSTNNLLRLRIEAELPQVWATYTAENGGAAMRLWLGELLADPAMQIENTITEAWTLSAQSSLAAYNDILSFSGVAKNVVTVPLTVATIKNLASKKLFAGQTLSGLIGKAFTEGQIATIIDSLDKGIANGWGYRKVIKDLSQTALDKGIEITRRQSITLARSYVQQASVNAQLAVYEANQNILKGVKWCAILDNRICELCAATDGNHYTFSEEKPPMPRHPRCMLPNTFVYAPDAIAAFKAQYDGPAFYFVLENGSYFYATANHPILTSKGFVPAHQIDQDSLIFCNEMHQGRGKHISEIYDKFIAGSGFSEKIELSQASLHGDGYYSHDYIELVQNPNQPQISNTDERFRLFEHLNCGKKNRSVHELLVEPENLLKSWSKGYSWLIAQRIRGKAKIHYKGPVYDLQTLSTLYYADRAIVSNCRCLWLPWIKSWRDLGINADELEKAARPWLIREPGNIDEGGNRKVLNAGTTAEDFSGWWATLPYSEQIKSIGPVRTKLINEGKLTWKDLQNRNTGHFYTLAELGFSESGNPLN